MKAKSNTRPVASGSGLSYTQKISLAAGSLSALYLLPAQAGIAPGGRGSRRGRKPWRHRLRGKSGVAPATPLFCPPMANVRLAPPSGK